MKTQISTLLKSFAVVLFSSFILTQAKAQCVAGFSSSTSACMVGFTNTSTGINSSTTYTWHFGDGQTSNLQTPLAHTYSASGTYTVCLTILVPIGTPVTLCTNTFCQPVTVTCATGIASSEQMDISLSVNNPVFSSAEIRYSIPTSGCTELVLLDIVGNKINTLETGNKSAGTYSYSFSTSALSKGIYFIRLNFEGAAITRKIIIAE